MVSKFSRGIFRIHLNGDQRKIIKFAAKGHNLLITGQAGVGKSEVVKRIIATSNARGRNVGIACHAAETKKISAVYVFNFVNTTRRDFDWWTKTMRLFVGLTNKARGDPGSILVWLSTNRCCPPPSG